jgi:hypothetical protein
MFKLLIKSIALLTMLLATMTFFTWSVEQLYPARDKQTSERNFIANAQAEANNIAIYQPIVPQNTHATVIQPQQPFNTKNATVAKKQQVEFEFKELDTKLTSDEQSHLNDMLKQLNIMPMHVVTVLAGPTPADNALFSAPVAKLRAQAVARVVYPYTQTIKMAYQPGLSPGVVIIEVSQTMKK